MSARQRKNQHDATDSIPEKMPAQNNTSVITRKALKFLATVIVSAGITTVGILFLLPRIQEEQNQAESLAQTVNLLKEKLVTLEQLQQSSSQAKAPDNEQASVNDTLLPLVKKIEERLSQLEQEVSAQRPKTVERSHKVEHIYQRLKALTALKKALSTSSPFPKEIDAVLDDVTPARDGDKVIFDKYHEIAKSGVPTIQNLENAFATKVLPTLQAGVPALKDGWREYIVGTLKSLIVIRKDEALHNPSQPWLIHFLQELKLGHLESALSILESSKSALSQELAAWKQDAERRVFVDRYYPLLKAYTLELLAVDNLDYNVPTSAHQDE